MNQAIIIPTCKKYKVWLDNLMATLDTEYPVIIVYNKEGENCLYESLAIKTGIELGIEEFFVLHDTCEIKDNSFFDIIFKEHKGKTVFLNPVGQMLMNKYVLKDIPFGVDIINKISCKWDAVMLEGKIPLLIRDKTTPIIFDTSFVDGMNFEHKFGRKNMVLENKYIRKLKGSWDGETVRLSENYKPKK